VEKSQETKNLPTQEKIINRIQDPEPRKENQNQIPLRIPNEASIKSTVDKKDPTSIYEEKIKATEGEKETNLTPNTENNTAIEKQADTTRNLDQDQQTDWMNENFEKVRFENEKSREFMIEMDQEKALGNWKTPNAGRKYLKKVEKWKTVIQNEKILFDLANYFAWRNNITMKELIDEIIELYGSKWSDEMGKEFGWKNLFRSNSQVKNEYVKKDNYVINKEDVEKLENWCKKHQMNGATQVTCQDGQTPMECN
jgi:hypothetical protein